MVCCYSSTLHYMAMRLKGPKLELNGIKRAFAIVVTNISMQAIIALR